MITRGEIERFFKSRNNPPVIGVSEAAAFLARHFVIDETIVRRWCRDSNIHRVGPNFILAPETVFEIAVAMSEETGGESVESDMDDAERASAPPSQRGSFESELAALINRNSLENGSSTPDFLLAAYLQGCLDNWNKCVTERDRWHGFESALAAGVTDGDLTATPVHAKDP